MLIEWELHTYTCTWNTFQDPARIQNQDLLNTSQTPSPLSYLDRITTLALVLFVYVLHVHVPAVVNTSSF